jgi:hypothetical protein
MSFIIREYSMEHFLQENPHYSQLTSTEFIAKYDTWLQNQIEEVAADQWINCQEEDFC